MDCFECETTVDINVLKRFYRLEIRNENRLHLIWCYNIVLLLFVIFQ